MSEGAEPLSSARFSARGSQYFPPRRVTLLTGDPSSAWDEVHRKGLPTLRSAIIPLLLMAVQARSRQARTLRSPRRTFPGTLQQLYGCL